MKKITFIFIALVLFAFLVSCNLQRVSSTIRVEVISFPFEEYKNRRFSSVALYVFRKGNDFVEPIAQPRLHPKRAQGGRFLIFDYPLQRNRDYRVVLNDSVVFDITDLHFRATDNRRRWEVVSMKVNGVLLSERDLQDLTFAHSIMSFAVVNNIPFSEEDLRDEDFRERWPYLPNYLIMPYSMGRIVHNDSKTNPQ